MTKSIIFLIFILFMTISHAQEPQKLNIKYFYNDIPISVDSGGTLAYSFILYKNVYVDANRILISDLDSLVELGINIFGHTAFIKNIPKHKFENQYLLYVYLQDVDSLRRATKEERKYYLSTGRFGKKVVKKMYFSANGESVYFINPKKLNKKSMKIIQVEFVHLSDEGKEIRDLIAYRAFI